MRACRTHISGRRHEPPPDRFKGGSRRSAKHEGLPMSATSLLEVRDLHVAYGQVEAVRGVSLALAPGEIVSVIGPNGAGKTTLLAAVMGLLPSTGTLRFDGADLS